MSDFLEFDGVDDAEIRRQKAKAREMRKTRWWQQKTSAGKCWYCGRKTAFKDLTMDHLVPLARGGKSTRENIVPSCKSCNTIKKSMLPLEWQEYLERKK
ncbi:HNH endonuclease [Desulfopila inferna]|uniref:HNH endonuclease n=1 Tax=Desulfopila inferna TaxID=468528 RepID=UPI00307F3ABE